MMLEKYLNLYYLNLLLDSYYVWVNGNLLMEVYLNFFTVFYKWNT